MQSLYKYFLVLITLLLLGSLPLMAQLGKPPRKNLTITINQGLAFGTFCPYGAGGTVTISDYGVRSYTGNIVLMSSTYHECSFTLSTTNYSREVLYLNIQTPVTLKRTGSNNTLSLSLDTSNNVGWDIYSYNPVTLYMGGTLTVRSITYNPGGTYTGSFTITAIYN